MRFHKLALSTLLGGAMSYGASAPVSAISVIGGSVGQILRVTIAAPADATCSALLRIQTGELLPARPDTKYDLAAGQAIAADIDIGRFAGRLGKRAELLPYVRVLAGQCTASLDVFDARTGRTAATVPMLNASTLQLTPSGATRNQIFRFAIIRGFDPQPDPPVCRAQLAFADARGKQAGETKTIELGPGQFDFLDLNANLLLPANPGELVPARTIVQPRLLLPASGGGDLRGCHATLQVFDEATGWTAAAVTER